MSVDIEKLEALAKAATPGPWWASRYGVIYGSVQSDDVFVGHIGDGADIAYTIAACNAVPELIARVRELELKNARLDAGNRHLIEELDELERELHDIKEGWKL